MEALPLYGWTYVAAFHRTYQELATTYRVPLVPFILANVIGDVRLMQPDRLHPNADGAQRMADNLWSHLYPLLRRTAPASSIG
jgi:acyl-CoA thioesterase-1